MFRRFRRFRRFRLFRLLRPELSRANAHHRPVAFSQKSAQKSASLARSSPERQGISSADILAFVEAADKDIDAMNSFMLVRHGHVVAEGWWGPYDRDTPHMLYSLSKSFTSTAVGLAISEGKLSLDDQVLKFFPEEAPAEPSANLRAMRVRDLLRMNTGHQSEAPFGVFGPAKTNDSWTKIFLAHPVPFKPGTHFLYNSPATYMLSAIVQKVTGMTLVDYLRPRLFEPLGFKDPTVGHQSTRNHHRCLRVVSAHGRDCTLRSFVSSEGKVERQAVNTCFLG